MTTEPVSGDAGQGGVANPGGAAPAPAPAAPAPLFGSQPPASSEGGAPAEKPWYDGFADPVKTVAQAKGWKSPEEAITSYANLEKLLGADRAGNAVIPPKADAPPEEVSAFFKKLGVPDDPKGYDLKPVSGFPEGDLGDTAAILHKAGVPPVLAKNIVAATGEFLASKAQEQEAQFLAARQADVGELKAEFGPAFDDKLELGRRAARAVGLSDDELAVAERVLGTKKLARLLIPAGEATGEAKAPPPGSASNFVMSPTEAQAKIQSMMADPQFMARYTSPNALVRGQAIAEMEKLQIAVAGR